MMPTQLPPGFILDNPPPPAPSAFGDRPVIVRRAPQPSPQTPDQQRKAAADADAAELDLKTKKENYAESHIAADPALAGLSGPDLLAKLPTGEKGIVQAMIEGRVAPPTGTAAKAPEWQRRLMWATQIDPTFDATNYNARLKARGEIVSGRLGKSNNALNTAIGHAGMLMDLVPETASHGPLFGVLPTSHMVNSVENTVLRQRGDPGITQWDYTANQLANELESVYTGGQGSEAGRTRQLENLDANMSAEQKRKVIHQALDLLTSKAAANLAQYQWAFVGGKPTWDMLDPEARATLSKYAPDVLEKYFATPAGSKDRKDEPALAASNGGDGQGNGSGGPGSSSPPNPLQQPDSGPPQVQISSSSQMVAPTADQQAAAAKLGAMIARGMPLANIQLFAKNNGLDYLKSNLAEIDAARRNPNSAVAKWLKQNPGKAYPVNLQPYNRPLSRGEEVGAEIAGSPFGAAAIGAGKTLTGDMLDEAIAAFGGDIDEVRRKEALLDEAHPLATAAGEFGAGALLPFPGAEASALAKIGAAGGLGGLYGFGSGEGNVIDRLPGALLGTATGLATGGAIEAAPKIGRFLFGEKGVPGGDDAVALARAAEQEGVPVSRPIVDPGSRAKMARIEAQPGGHAPVREGLEATRRGLEERAEGLRGTGAPQEPGVMGQRIQDAVQRDMDAQRQRAGALYERASEAAGDATVEGREAVAELDEQIAKLGRNPNTNRALLNYLRSVRSDFVGADGKLLPKTVDEIRQLRTTLSGEINRRNLTKTPAEGIVSKVLDRAKDDIERDLYDAGPKGAEARALYRQGDILWRLAKRDERQVAQKLLGRADAPMRGDQALNAALAWVREGAEGRTLARRFWDKLNPDERADFAATLAEKYGRRTPDEDFSPAQFVAATRTIPPSSRALIFGEDGARSIANLRALSKAYTAAQKSLNNSRSGMVSNWAHFLAGLTKGGVTGSVIGGIAGGVPGGIAGGVALSGAEALIRRLSAKMLMSPDMTRWLATAPLATTEQKVVQHIARLTKIAARNPAIAQDALGLRNALLENIGSKVPAAVADTPQDRSDAPSPAPSETDYSLVTNPDRSSWDRRADGSPKGEGWLGVLRRPDGSVSSEISIGIPASEVGGDGHGDIEIPLMVPGLTAAELDYLMKNDPASPDFQRNLPRSIMLKAIAHARQRVVAGRSPFRQDGEASAYADEPGQE